MNRLKRFFEKYSKWILVAAAVLLVLKSCQSCQRKTESEFVKAECEHTEDSLLNEISTKDAEIAKWQDSVRVLSVRLEGEHERVKTLTDDKAAAQRLNEKLAAKHKK